MARCYSSTYLDAEQAMDSRCRGHIVCHLPLRGPQNDGGEKQKIGKDKSMLECEWTIFSRDSSLLTRQQSW